MPSTQILWLCTPFNGTFFFPGLLQLKSHISGSPSQLQHLGQYNHCSEFLFLGLQTGITKPYLSALLEPFTLWSQGTMPLSITSALSPRGSLQPCKKRCLLSESTALVHVSSKLTSSPFMGWWSSFYVSSLMVLNSLMFNDFRVVRSNRKWKDSF